MTSQPMRPEQLPTCNHCGQHMPLWAQFPIGRGAVLCAECAEDNDPAKAADATCPHCKHGPEVHYHDARGIARCYDCNGERCP